MTCQGCEGADKDPTYGLFVYGCSYCRARMLSRSPRVYRERIYESITDTAIREQLKVDVKEETRIIKTKSGAEIQHLYLAPTQNLDSFPMEPKVIEPPTWFQRNIVFWWWWVKVLTQARRGRFRVYRHAPDWFVELCIHDMPSSSRPDITSLLIEARSELRLRSRR